MKARGLAALGLLLAATVGGWWWQTQRPAAPAGPAAPAARYVPAFDRPAQRLSGDVLVNDAPAARLGSGVPVYVEVTLRNPFDGAVPLAATPALTLEVRRSDGTSVSPATFTRIGDWPARIEPTNTAVVAWTLAESLPAGTYDIVVTGGESWPDGDAYRATFAPARVEISPEAAPDQAEAAVIRLLMLRGQPQDALTRLEAALAGDDEHLLFRLWRADALEMVGRGDDARNALLELGTAITARQRRGGRQVELPYWLAARLSGSPLR